MNSVNMSTKVKGKNRGHVRASTQHTTQAHAESPLPPGRHKHSQHNCGF